MASATQDAVLENDNREDRVMFVASCGYCDIAASTPLAKPWQKRRLRRPDRNLKYPR
jgi:hypothetical protein